MCYSDRLHDFTVTIPRCYIRPSQVACAVTIVQVRYTQMMLHMHKNLSTLLIENTVENYLLPAILPFCFKKIRTITTAAFLISNTVVPNPYCHIAALDPQSFAPLS